MSHHNNSVDRAVDDIFAEPDRPSMLRTEEIPRLSVQIARARDTASPQESAIRARAEQVLEDLARLYSARSTKR